MPSFLSHLTKTERQELLADLNYLNTAEIQSFCKKHRIPYVIAVETAGGARRKTSAHDRKGVMLKRMRYFLKTGAILEETRFPVRVINLEVPKKFTANSKLFYGQYNKNNPKLMTLLKNLTDGEFADGAIARIRLREFWAAGIAPTYKQFAAAWRRARKKHSRPNPEWVFLADLANKTAGNNWKALRMQKAKRVLATLDQIFQ